MNRLGKFFDIRSGEGKLVAVFAFLLLSNMVGQQVSSIVSVSGFMNHFGPKEMVLVNLVDYVVVLVIVSLQSLTIDRSSRVRQTAIILVVYAALYVLIRITFYLNLANWLSYGLLYVVADQTFWYFPALVWALTNDVFSMEQGKRFFNSINSGATVGSLLGIGISILAPRIVKLAGISTPDVLYLNAGLYLLSFILVVTSLQKASIRKIIPKDQSVKETLSEGIYFIREIPFFKFMVIFVIAYWITYAVLDYRFYVWTQPVFTSMDAYQSFYGTYRLVSIISLLLTQLILTNPVLDRLQMKNSFFLTPVMGVIVGSLLLGAPGFWTAVLGMFTYILVLRAFTRVAWKTAASLIPEEKRGRVTLFLEAYVPAVFIWLSYAISLGMTELGTAAGWNVNGFFPVMVILLGVIGLYAAYKISKTYETSLMNWRLRRRTKLSSPILNKLKDL